MVEKFIASEIEGKHLWFNFHIYDDHYSVISVARFLQQGCKALLSSEYSRLEGPSDENMPVIRYGSFLFLWPKFVSVDLGE